ncbi:uncharacterized protein LOC132464678 isoform X1 [Gadus macrocephalus]|uniref:uncharacterized protein LOC132464678 isoform X1 n=2 Tax=Gadus macrocephalus TaxID=80720 RepID=UPI0028CB9D32|nr:uncharacterized protein LOC132464678 isoform X1 [Gadus macrocephalus]
MAKFNDKFSPHITVQQTGVRPPLEKCVTCCTSIHCPFCSPDKFKPTIRSRVCKHLEGHLLRAVQLKDYTIYKCNLECWKKRAHFHCPSCTLLFDRRDRLLKHMAKCFAQVLEVVDQAATTNNSDHEEDVNMVFSGHMEEVQCKQEATEIQVDIMDDVHSTRDNTENLVHIKEDVHSSRDNTENQVHIMEDCQSTRDATENQVHIMEDCHSTRDATENQVHIVEDVHSSQEAKVATAQVRRSKVVVSCPRCAIGILKKNLNLHLLRKHSEHHRMEVTSKSNVRSEGLDSAKRRCSKTRQSCQHKSIAKWHSCPGVFQKVRSSQYISENQPIQTGTLGNTSVSEDDFTRYPPEGEDLEKMVEYISQHKRLPTTLPDHLRKHMSDYPRSFTPEEEFCTVCPGAVSLSRPIVITEKAKILTIDGIVQDVSTFCRKCEDCGMIYRYQEFTDGVHNFNDYLLLGLHFCLFLRYQLQTNQAVGSAVQALEQLTKTKFPPADSVMHGYLHFEAMSSHSYDFSCVCCGDQPPIVIMDLHKKGSFHQTVSDLQSPPDDYKGEVNMEDFWDSVSNEHIALGFLTSIQMNPYAVSPSFDCWAPWIGERTRRSAVALNTEFQKLQTPKAPGENAEWTVTEDHLLNELLNQEVEVVRKLCEECDLDPRGSRMDLIFRLKDEMKTPESFEKVFQKIWGASGGWAAILCPCGIVYSLKGLLRAGSPRDFADLLLSWAHVPNKVVYDFSSVLARQMNLRAPESVPFAPHEGRLVAPTTQNIGGANEGSLKVNLTWLTEKRNPADERSHPLTGSSESYSLRDTSEDSGNVLSRVGLAPELSGRINTQVVQQFFSQMRECNYFLTSSPSTNIFLLRNILHHRNVRVNESSTGQI